MSHCNVSRNLLAFALPLALYTVLPGTVAEEDFFALEEIIITAQKRDESLQDVPISVSAMSGVKIRESGLQRFEDFSAYVPNFSVTRQPIGDKINIRGIQSGNQAGFEQSVGTFVDGIYRGRGTQSRYAFLDVEMVEILRGPQGTLFGKNTIAGALNIRSAKPSEEFESEISVGYNLNFDETEYQAYVSAPLGDSVSGRVVFLNRSMDKGWVDNTFYDHDISQTDESAGRISLEWDASDSTTVSFKTEYADFEVVGQPWDQLQAGPLAAFGIVGNKDYETTIGNIPAAPFDTFYGNINDPNGVMDFGSNGDMEGTSNETVFTVETELNNGSTVTAIVGYSVYEYERFADADFGPSSSLRFDDTEDFDQTSVELRLASETTGDFEYISGLFYQEQNLTVDGLLYFNLGTLQPLRNGACASGLGAAYAGAFVSGDAVATATNVATAVGAGGGAGAALANDCGQAAALDPLVQGMGVNGGNRYALLDQDTESWALFTQGTWNLSNEWRLTLGIRYTEEEKEASQSVIATDFVERGQSQTADATLTSALEAVGEFSTHRFGSNDPGMSRDEESLTWSANVQWDVTRDTMLYGTASTGFKAGGYNSFFMGSNSNDAGFEEEDVITFEVGSKMTLLGGEAELNTAMFRTEFDDLQVSIFTGGTTFVVQNAAKAVSQGIEIDGRWRATEKLTVTASLGYIDFEFEDFEKQACTAAQFSRKRQEAYEAALTVSDLAAGTTSLTYTNGTCAANGENNIKGGVSENTPEYQVSFSANYVQPIGNHELTLNMDVNWMDEVYRQGDLDPVSLDDAQVKINSTATFAPQDGKWDVAVIMKNLTDETTLSYVNDTPLFNGAHQALVDAPRSFTLRGRLRF